MNQTCVLCKLDCVLNELTVTCDSGTSTTYVCTKCFSKVERAMDKKNKTLEDLVVQAWLHGKLCNICSYDSVPEKIKA